MKDPDSYYGRSEVPPGAIPLAAAFAKLGYSFEATSQPGVKGDCEHRCRLKRRKPECNQIRISCRECRLDLIRFRVERIVAYPED
jgi:hypothetical protein